MTVDDICYSQAGRSVSVAKTCVGDRKRRAVLKTEGTVLKNELFNGIVLYLKEGSIAETSVSNYLSASIL